MLSGSTPESARQGSRFKNNALVLGSAIAVIAAIAAMVVVVREEPRAPKVRNIGQPSQAVPDGPRDDTRALLMNIAQRLEKLERKAELTNVDGEESQATVGTESRVPISPADRKDHSPEILATYDTALKAESLDRNFESEIRGRLERVFASAELKGMSLELLKCGSTLCRVEAGTSDPSKDPNDNAERLINALATSGPHGGVWVNHVVGGPNRVMAFIAREGARLPELPPS